MYIKGQRSSPTRTCVVTAMSSNNGESLDSENKKIIDLAVKVLEDGLMKAVAERKDLHDLLVRKIAENAEAIHIQTLKELLDKKDAEIVKMEKGNKEFPEFLRRKMSKWIWPLNYFF